MNALNHRWEVSEGGEPALRAELSLAEPPIHDEQGDQAKSRRSERVPVELNAGLRQRGASPVAVHLLDLSTDGFKIETHLDLVVGTDVWLRLPNLEPCFAHVAWTDGNLAGCAFERPLHPAVLDMVVRRAKSG